MKRINWITLAFAALLLGNCAVASDAGDGLRELLFGEDKKGDVNIAAAIALVPEIVPTVAPGTGGQGAPGSGGSGVPVHDLFALPPGTQVLVSRMVGAIDPVGTSLPNDFDGDGILNANETTTSLFVADYPIVEASIAAPITMKIEMLNSNEIDTVEITSEINSNDFQSNDNRGNEKVHRNEVNEKTVQFQDSYGTSSGQSEDIKTERKKSKEQSVGIMGFSLGGGGSSSRSASRAWSNNFSRNETTTKWADKPFKNNLDRSAWSVKSDSSAKKARKYRAEKRSNEKNSFTIKPNAGYVRAALYIKNLSVNMPVRLSNILCSLMFESPTGELIPVQSFRLRNSDFSLFEVDVYGDTEFGPYVVELTGLNTAEIEKAIQQGYNPKIYIVSYDMNHVPDSNYKSSLLNFSGNNLKIVEENAKGRTALIKVMGPELRRMYRVAAFSTSGNTDPCTDAGVTSVAPGVSLRDTLTRIGCTGMAVEFDNYVLDLSEQFPGLSQAKVHMPMVKSVGGVANRIPCVDKSFTGSDSVVRTACEMKPIDQWTEQEQAEFGMWVIFSKGKYYAHSEYVQDGTSIRTLDGGTPENGIPMIKGMDSIMWAGDHFDLVYVTLPDIQVEERNFGTNPLETGDTVKVNTKWDRKTLGQFPFDPDAKSVFMGTAGLGDRIEFTFQLKDTTVMNYSFGANQHPSPSNMRFTDFSYTKTTHDPATAAKLYSLKQAIDFELSLGLGGTYGDWHNLVRGVNASDAPSPDARLPTSCGQSLDFLAQTFTVCIELPVSHDFVAPDSVVGVYIRPSLNSAYRNTIWPNEAAKVKKFQGTASANAAAGGTQVLVNESAGTPVGGDTLDIGGDSYVISGAPVLTDGVYTIDLSTPLSSEVLLGTAVSVAGGLSSSEVTIELLSDFFAEYNANTTPADHTNPVHGDLEYSKPLETVEFLDAFTCLDTLAGFHPMQCLGLDVGYLAANWAGNHNFGNPHWNTFLDAGGYDTLLDPGTALNPLLSPGSGSLNIIVNDTSGYGLNHFFKSPLIERNFDVSARFK